MLCVFPDGVRWHSYCSMYNKHMWWRTEWEKEENRSYGPVTRMMWTARVLWKLCMCTHAAAFSAWRPWNFRGSKLLPSHHSRGLTPLNAIPTLIDINKENILTPKLRTWGVGRSDQCMRWKLYRQHKLIFLKKKKKLRTMDWWDLQLYLYCHPHIPSEPFLCGSADIRRSYSTLGWWISKADSSWL